MQWLNLQEVLMLGSVVGYTLAIIANQTRFKEKKAFCFWFGLIFTLTLG